MKEASRDTQVSLPKNGACAKHKWCTKRIALSSTILAPIKGSFSGSSLRQSILLMLPADERCGYCAPITQIGYPEGWAACCTIISRATAQAHLVLETLATALFRSTVGPRSLLSSVRLNFDASGTYYLDQ